LKDNAHDPALRWQTARTWLHLGDIQEMLGRHDDAEKRYGQAVGLLSLLAREFDGESRYRTDLAAAHHGLARLNAAARRHDSAARHYGEARRLRRRLHDESPDDPTTAQALAASCHDVGLLFRARGRTDDAERSLRRAVTLQTKLVQNPSSP